MHHTLGIVAVDDGIVVGVEALELGKHRRESQVEILLLGGLAHLVAHVGHHVDALAHGVDIHHRPAAHHGIVAPGPQAGEQRHHIGFILCGAVVLVEVFNLHKMVGHQRLLQGSGSGRAYGYALEHLARVGVDDLAAQLLGRAYGCCRLSHASRACDNNERLAVRHLTQA